jgi:hypothetical protein
MRKSSLKLRVAGLFGLLALLWLVAIAQAETAQEGNLRVSFEGQLSPQALPRSGQAPVKVSVSVKVASTDGAAPPPMREISIAINRYGRLDATGLPVCRLDQIQPATTDDALAACPRSLVGEGRFLADVVGNAPFPADGKVYAFNGEVDGKPAILAHVYGTAPAPASYTLAFLVSRSKGTFGTTLKAKLPPVKADSGHITAIYLTLGKSFSAGGKRHSYFSASCPAPKGFTKAVFPFAKASVGFQGAPPLGTTLTRTCQAKG